LNAGLIHKPRYFIITRYECFVDEYIYGDDIDDDEHDNVRIDHHHPMADKTITTMTTASNTRCVEYDGTVESEEHNARSEVSV